MKKINKEVIISTVLCLLPMVFGILVYGKLPDEIPTKWYSDGTVGQYMPKAFTVFGMPVLFAVVNGLVHFSINTDPKKQNIGSMVKMIGKWVIPVLAMAAIPTAILWGMGIEIPIDRILPVILGIVFVLIGNYFPKCRRNYTTGIKTPWALDSDENWRKTHHMAAFLWIAAGMVMIAQVFLPGKIGMIAMGIMVALLIILPYAYSYLLYRKGI